MGATYTRQSASAIVDGGVIEASDINAEFNQVLAAFAVTSGHTHDGTAAEGGPITKLLGTAITIGDATAGTDIAVTFDGETADGVLTWMEDEDYFKFSDDILMNSTERLNFGTPSRNLAKRPLSRRVDDSGRFNDRASPLARRHAARRHARPLRRLRRLLGAHGA